MARLWKLYLKIQRKLHAKMRSTHGMSIISMDGKAPARDAGPLVLSATHQRHRMQPGQGFSVAIAHQTNADRLRVASGANTMIRNRLTSDPLVKDFCSSPCRRLTQHSLTIAG